jgi:hypothetical protein
MSDADQEDNAEPGPDQWDALLDRLHTNIDEIYSNETIDALVELEKANLGRYVRFRERLGEVKGFRAKEYEKRFNSRAKRASSLSPDPEDDVELLTQIAETATYFVSADNADLVFAELPDTSGHMIVVSIHSKRYRRWLIANFKAKRRRAPGREAVKVAIDGVDADAVEAGITHKLYLRVGFHNGKIYLDRGTPEWDAIEIDAMGWRLVPQAPCKFIRPPVGLGILPEPKPGGDIAGLYRLLNLESERDFLLLLIWLLSCFRPINAVTFAGEYAMLLIVGEHGSAKTSLLKAMAALVDPILAKPPKAPREDRDVMVVGSHRFLLPMDNLKDIPVSRAATLCLVLSGSTDVSRELYSDAGMVMVTAFCPIIATATTMVVTEMDLFDRSIIVFTGEPFETEDSAPVVQRERKTAEDLEAEFTAAWPRLLGAVLTAVSHGLRNQHTPKPGALPRLADLAVWAHRCESGFGFNPGILLEALREAVRNAARDAAEHDPVASAVLALMADAKLGGKWEGTATDLWSLLKNRKHGTGFNLRDFPASPSAFRRRLNELRVVLRRNQIVVQSHRTDAARMIYLTKIAPGSARATP